MIRMSAKIHGNSANDSVENKYFQQFLLRNRVTNPNYEQKIKEYNIWERMCAEELLNHREAIQSSESQVAEPNALINLFQSFVEE